MNFTAGNAHDAQTQGTGWFIGFSDWTLTGPPDLLHVPREQALSGLCVKWLDHPPGDESGDSKPLSEGRTVSILVSDDSAFRIEFSEKPGFPAGTVESVLLQRHGDFVAWGAGLHHRWCSLSRSTMLTLRWQSCRT